ncbi:allophanate hydrolase [Methylobacterium gregans]|uniref:5-oxoprolinase subunit B n=1 Tax=Methylobacterium gregans TaxID=374424 RepID=A0AA37HPI2_9HYPH|nr:allophanate hydrolase subunit 1 [Methylobacterium gregans]MDQ0523486.1 KipI family sensor histidine kinase inhibitor [Methylobacterium gregans]GJD78607.1 5-oxoprolinase subunit B [Methylobacterium gregans]GLS55836.1 allophanate hydrolase [Methylobacterium gregans]
MKAPDPEPADRPRFLDAGEAALVVEFGAAVDPAINDRVLALDAALGADPPLGLAETVPTYRSLMIHYDPLVLSRAALVAAVEGRLAERGAARGAGRLWTIPCCYDPALAEDIAEAASLAGLAVADAAAFHAGALYRVYMYGFAPGFAYLGGLPEALALPRRSSPRAPHPPGAVMIGGGLAAIGTMPMPTGWYVLGRTPERLFAPERDPAFLIESGDTLRFEPVSADTFAGLERRAASGEVVAGRAA